MENIYLNDHNLPNYSVEAYRKSIIKVMKQEKRGLVKSITVIAKVKDPKKLEDGLVKKQTLIMLMKIIMK